jgi:transposase
MGGTDNRFDAVGVKEIVDRLGVSRATVEKWQARGRRGHAFPAPVRDVGGRPAWHWPDVVRWHRASGTEQGATAT